MEVAETVREDVFAARMVLPEACDGFCVDVDDNVLPGRTLIV